MALIAGRRRSSFAIALLCGCVSLADSAPLAARDENPLLAGFGLPSALSTDLPQEGAWTGELTYAWGSSAIVQANPNETLIVDAETREWRVALARAFGQGYVVRLEVPYRQTTSGSLDSFIDDWHDVFGLPEGARPALPEDALMIRYVRDGALRFEQQATTSGVGDVSLQLIKRFETRPLSAWLTTKFPTGDADALTGSGSIDVTAGLAIQRTFGRYDVFAQAAATWLSEGDRLQEWQENLVWSGLAGASIRFFQNLELTLQLDAHTAVYDSDEDFLGDALTLTIGGTYRLSDHWQVGISVVEDIGVESAPDVTFVFEIRRR